MLPQAEWNSDKMSKMSQIFSPVFFFLGGGGGGVGVLGGGWEWWFNCKNVYMHNIHE